MNNVIQRYTDEHGETIVYAPENAVSIQTIETLEEWREAKRVREAIRNGPIQNYVNCYHESAASLNNVLSVDELGAIMKLITYIKMNADGALYYEGKRMNNALMAKAIGKGVRQTATIAATLHRVGVLSREKVGRTYVYSVEDRYHSMGYVVKGEQYTKVMQVKTRTDVRNLSVQAAGVLYKMLPFFNYEHFYLCTNPNEAEEDAIYPISHRQFADLVDVDRNVIDRGVKELMRFGFIGKFSSSNGELYAVNPDIATRRKNIYDETSEKMRGMFRMATKQAISVKKSELPF